jgi:hypothetical protein
MLIINNKGKNVSKDKHYKGFHDEALLSQVKPS